MPQVELFERRPDPPPAKVEPTTLAATGTAAWLLATLVVGVLDLLGRIPENWLHVCFTGLGLGLLASLATYWAAYRRDRRRPAEEATGLTGSPR